MRPDPRPDHLHVDVLVLGAGLSGLTAARAASSRGASVAVVSALPGPTGSSFSNCNDALGIQALLTDEERSRFRAEVLAAAGPGQVMESLVDVLAEEGEGAVRQLHDLGVPLRQEPGMSEPARCSGCFSASAPRAWVVGGLREWHARLRAPLDMAGVRFLEGFGVAAVTTRNGGAQGAILQHASDRSVLAIRAGAVVMALGGPAPLFAHSLAGRGVSGASYGLLARAGAELANCGFVQFLWVEAGTCRFFPVQSLADEGSLVRTASGDVEPPPEFRTLSREREVHCPFGYGLPDSALDLFLARHLREDGTVEVVTPDGNPQLIVPAAQAGNGGALISPDGATTVEGLYACGESATGMHGANRLGGAMTLACLVFGRRAGETAARHASSAGPAHDMKEFPEMAWPHSGLPLELRRAMQRHAVLGGGPGLPDLQSRLLAVAATDPSPELQSALLITSHLSSLGKHA